MTVNIRGVITQEVEKGKEWTQSEADAVELELKKRAVKDPEFRALALKNPQAAIAKINPKPLPKGFKVKCVEMEGANLVVVLADPVGRVEELSDFDLEAVAGGTIRQNNNNNTKPCWIAAAVYDGWFDPRTILVREWLNTEFIKQPIGRVVMALYLRFGERVAERVKRYSTLRSTFKLIMDQALEAAREWKGSQTWH